MKQPIISIVMSVFNDDEYLERCLESILSQTFKSWELIIVDDKSTDKSLEILKKYKYHNLKIKLFINKVNVGLTKNLNYGINKSAGKYIARIDADDEWIDNDKLAKQINFLESHPEYSLVGTYANAVDVKNNILFKIQYPLEDNDIRDKFLLYGCFVHSSILFRRDVFNAINGYNENFRFAQDNDLYLKLGSKYKIKNLPHIMTNYRINPNGVSRNKYKQQMNNIRHIIKLHKDTYPHYMKADLMWKVRSFYPIWFRGSLSRDIKKMLFGKENI